MEKRFITICFSNFLIAATMGLLLRLLYVLPIDSMNFRFLTHAHSHTAMLGWVYLSIQLFIVKWYIKDNTHKKYKRLFWITQLSIIGMLVSFPFQGYAMVSISFSTLHIFCSYTLAYYAFKEIKATSPANKFMRLAIYFMLFSTIGVWCLGPTVVQYGKSSELYQLAIQFFLHFQFNGWFLIAVLSLIFRELDIKNSVSTKRLYGFTVIATLLTYAFPASWYLDYSWLYWVNSIGVILQLIMVYYMFIILKKPLSESLKKQLPVVINLYRFAIITFLIKTLIQILTLVPVIATQAHAYKNLVIGFIHLIMLGVISSLLYANFHHLLNIKKEHYFKLGVYLFLTGIFITEALLFMQGSLYMLKTGISIPNYYLTLFLASLFLVIGIIFLIISIQKSSIKKSAYITKQ
ncbi:hypothetical protein [Joostella sp.]|uniref:hypothetical protein n=1 Tax=Joostella sp. TaxID=2231138 RepID=UPI003A942D22